MHDRVSTIKILLKHGARPNARDICGKNHMLHFGGKFTKSTKFKLQTWLKEQDDLRELLQYDN